MLTVSIDAAGQTGQPEELTRIGDLRNLPNDNLNPLEVIVQGTVTYCDPSRFVAFIQDETGGIYTNPNPKLAEQRIRAGALVQIKGRTVAGSVRLDLHTDEVTVLSGEPQYPVPVPIPPTFKDASQELDSNWGQVEVAVRSVKPTSEGGRYIVLGEFGSDLIQIDLDSDKSLDELKAQFLGSISTFDGVAAYNTTNAEEGVDLILYAPDDTYAKTLTSPNEVARSLGIRSLAEIKSGEVPLGTVVRTQGALQGVYGSTAAIADGDQAIVIRYPKPIALATPNETVECFGRLILDAKGNTQIEGYGLMIHKAETPVINTNPKDLGAKGKLNIESRKDELISIDATFLYKTGDEQASVLFREQNEDKGVIEFGAPGAREHDWQPNGIYKLTGVWSPSLNTLIGNHPRESAEYLGTPLSLEKQISTLTFLAFFLFFSFVSTVYASTRLAQSKNALRAACDNLEAEQSATLDTTSEGVLITTLEGGLRNINQRFREIWGIPDHESSQGACDNLSGYAEKLVADKDAFWSQIFQVVEDPTLETWDTLHFVDGRIIERHSRPQTLNGKPVGRVWRFRDVTIREEERMRLKAIMSSVAEAIIGADSEGKIRVVNSAARALIAADGHPVIEASVHDLLVLEESNPSNEGPTLLLGKLLRKDGLEIPVEVSVSGGASTASELKTYVIRDIRERLAEEERRAALEKREKEAEKLAAIGSLAGGVAHDFNNIVGSMLLNARFLEKSREGSKAEEAIEDIIDAGEQAQELVTQVLTFSRQDEATKHVVDLLRTIRLSIRELRNRFPGSVELEAEGLEEGRKLWGNAAQLRQLVTNLAQNAIQAMLTAQTENPRVIVRLLPADGAGNLILEVTDNGPGIPEEMINRVFDPFFTTKAPGEGVGLGLSVAHGVTEAHNGSISVTSTPEEGTVFRMVFPELTESGSDETS